MRGFFLQARAKILMAVAGSVVAMGSLWPQAALAHGAADYTVIEIHYVMIGPFAHQMPYHQHKYYCDGHYEFTPGPGGSVGYASSMTVDNGPC